MMKKRAILLFGILIICISMLFGLEGEIIFQEGNPVPIAVGIAKLNFSGGHLVKITSLPEMYLVRTRDGNKPFISFMEKDGWHFTDQMGAGLVFERIGERKVYTSRMYTRYYQIIR